MDARYLNSLQSSQSRVYNSRIWCAMKAVMQKKPSVFSGIGPSDLVVIAGAMSRIASCALMLLICGLASLPPAAVADEEAGPHETCGYEWTKVTGNAAFAPRDGAGALVYRDKMWLVGGWNPSDKLHFPRKCTNDVWNSTDGVAWNLVRPNTYGTDTFATETEWEGRHTAGYATFRNKLWLIGGDPLQGHYQYDVWNSKDGETWNHVNEGHPVPWGPRALHYTVVFRDMLWVMGGQTIPQFAPAETQFHDDIWNSADGIHWTKVEPRGPHWPARGMIGGNAVFKNRIWILGGGTYDTPDVPERSFYNDVWSSPDGIQWECQVEHALWQPRQYHEVAVFDDCLWVLEGWNQSNRNDVWYSADGTDWTELPGTPWAPRHAASVFVYQDALWVVAGNNMESDVWKLQRTGTAVAGTK